jgi:hypothetical protein
VTNVSSDDSSTDEYHSADRTVSLALAVRFVDSVTGQPPVTLRGDRPNASFDGFDSRPRRTSDGYDVFIEIPPGEPTVTVDPGDRFFPPPAPVVVTAADRESTYPTVEIPLEPTPAYVFPAGTTLVRGVLRGPKPDPADESEGPPIAAATVKLVGVETPPNDSVEIQTTTTTDRGEFVLYLPEDGEWTVDDGDAPVVRVSDADPLIDVSHSDAGAGSVSLTLRESKTTAVSLTLDGNDLSIDRTVVR